jgi:phosphatidylglycerophosphate synthase
MTPNQATAISAAFTCAGLIVLATVQPGAAMAVAVAALLAAGYVMDSVDGQLARLRGGGSLSGEWLDHTVDCFKTCTLHLAVLISWYRFPPVDFEYALLVPIVFQVVDVVSFFGLIAMPLIRASRPAPPTGGASATESPLRKWLILPTDYGFVCWTFVLLAWPAAFFTAYTALMLANGGVLVLALRKWWRELRAIDR